jgi:hypothetical protein
MHMVGSSNWTDIYSATSSSFIQELLQNPHTLIRQTLFSLACLTVPSASARGLKKVV